MCVYVREREREKDREREREERSKGRLYLVTEFVSKSDGSVTT